MAAHSNFPHYVETKQEMSEQEIGQETFVYIFFFSKHSMKYKE